jgi:hypothetical protein
MHMLDHLVPLRTYSFLFVYCPIELEEMARLHVVTAVDFLLILLITADGAGNPHL